MSKSFRALLWKETLEVSRHAVPALILVAIAFYGSIAGSSTSHFIGGDSDPARNFGWYGGLTALVAVVIGFWQTWHESDGDMWGHALHRPAARTAIFAAKPVVGIAALLISVGLPYAMAMWWYAVPGHRPVPFDRSFLLPGIADLTAGITFYAAGLYAGTRRSSILRRATGFVVAVVTSLYAATSVSSFALAVAIDLGVATVLMTAAAANFLTGSDYERQPIAARVANFLSVAPAVLLALTLGTIIIGAVLPRTEKPPRESPDLPPEAFVTADGRIALIHRGPLDSTTGVRPVVSVTDLSGTRLAGADSGLTMRTGAETYAAGPIATDSSWLGFYFERPSYRNTRAWVTRILSDGEGPVWYFERREGLISIYDWKTAKRTGWLGPQGYSPAAAKPAMRFPGALRGEIEQDGPRSGLLVLSEGVYRIDGLSRPQPLFTPREGESVISAAQARSKTAVSTVDPWGAFSLVTTTKATYVIRPDAKIEIMQPRDSATGLRMVSAVRAPRSAGGTTFLWYHSRYYPTRDTLNLAIEFRHDIAQPVARFVFSGWPYEPERDVYLRAQSFAMSAAAPVAISREESTEVSAIGFGPAFEIYSAGKALTAEDRAKALRALAIAFGVCLIFAAFTWWLCRRYAFSNGRTLTWVMLTAFLGPVTLVTMWMLFQWPSRERCPSCGKMRVTNRERCEHCDAPFAAPESDGTEVFAT